MRILYVTTIGSTMNFFKLLIRSLLDEGHIVDIATNEDYKKVPTYYSEWGCKVYPISCVRSPFKKTMLKLLSKFVKLLIKIIMIWCIVILLLHPFVHGLLAGH